VDGTDNSAVLTLEGLLTSEHVALGTIKAIRARTRSGSERNIYEYKRIHGVD